MKPSDLSEFFNLLGKAKKEKEEEFDNLLKEADINLDDLTSSLVSGITVSYTHLTLPTTPYV